MIFTKKKLTLTALIAGMGLCILLAMQGVAHAILFSIDAASPSVLGGGVSAADILTQSGPIGGPPTVAFTQANVGLGPGDDINALQAGASGGLIPFFSVDRLSAGVAGTPLAVEAGVGQAAGDIYVDPTFGVPPPGTNVLNTNQAALGLLPAVPPGTAAMPPIDNINALDLNNPVVVDPDGDGIPNPGTLFFSLAAGSPTLTALGATAADILTSAGGAVGVALPGAAINLNPGDDVDALLAFLPLAAVPASNFVSLAPGSPSVAIFGVTAADLLDPVPGGAGVIFGPSGGLSNLGLGVTDNMDAFASPVGTPVAPIPEPSTLLLLASGLAGMGAFTRKRSRVT